MLKFLVPYSSIEFGAIQFQFEEWDEIITEAVTLTQGNTFCLSMYVLNIPFEHGLLSPLSLF
jgi:hypothetical protein